MSDDSRQKIESYVGAALKSRLEEGAGGLAELREEMLAALGRLEARIKEAGEKPVTIPEDLLPEPAPEPAADEALLSHLLSAQDEMLNATDQVGLLTTLLLACTVSCPRVGFFIVKKDAIVGWAARGFEGAQDADVRNLSTSVSQETILAAACRAGTKVQGRPGEYAADADLFSTLGGPPSGESVAIPVFIRDKVVAVLYGDAGQEEKIVSPEIPEILGLHAGLCLETLSTRAKYPRPRAGAGTPPVGVSRSGAPTPSASLSGAFRPEASSAGAAAVAPTPPAPEPPTPPAAEEIHEATEVAEEIPEVAQVEAEATPPPAPAVAGETPAPAPSLDHLPEDERKLHEEAKRFARLLVSEIVLYNEKQAEEGRRNKDLYDRLKDDTNRSLQMYEQRVSGKIRSSSNYFYEELVRTLANGDRSALTVPWA